MHKQVATIVRKPNFLEWSNIPIIPIAEHLETPQVESPKDVNHLPFYDDIAQV